MQSQRKMVMKLRSRPDKVTWKRSTATAAATREAVLTSEGESRDGVGAYAMRRVERRGGCKVG
jgi:hypothetical protein